MIEKSEFIGKELTITKASDDALVGVRGKVIDETRQTITIASSDGKKKILIKSTMTFTIGGKKIDGKTVNLRPEERIKRTKK